MIEFQGKEYELFFSNDLETVRALNFAGPEFFAEFERLCGDRYRVLSVIRNGRQEKYGLREDIERLTKTFKKKIAEPQWIDTIVAEYEDVKSQYEKFLSTSFVENLAEVSDDKLFDLFKSAFELFYTLAAMSNMLNTFSSVLSAEFQENLKKYSADQSILSKNFLFYTQPLKESRYAKIAMPTLDNAFKLDEYDNSFSKILRTGVYIKDDVAALQAERAKLLDLLLSEIQKRLKFPDIKDPYYLTLPELSETFRTKKVPTDLLKSRHDITILFYASKELQLLEGDRAENFLKKGEFKTVEVDTNVKELKGQTGSPGYAKGPALVLDNFYQIMDRVKKGDVLVAKYTSTECVPAMQKAIAIVTETGGITTHAAVVSREFKIPCVIGVPNATKIIKTGDTIEVNANEGIIKLLK